MLFIYIAAILMATAINYGCIVLLTLPDVWTMPHTIGIFVLLMIILGTSWAIYTMFKAAREELVYWF